MSVIKKLQDTDKEQLLKETLEKAYENQNLCNSFVTILKDAKVKEKTSSLLSNIPYAIKDNFSTKDILTTASSNSLKNYIPPYSATVYEKLEASGAICIGKTVLDEFGMGGTGTTGHTGIVKNPWNLSHIAGGSSAGSAACVASGVVPFALGSDTGDSIRKPAAYCGIVGYKPTYGMISRYGLLPFASSLDHVGVLSRSVYDAALVASVIKGKDSHDMTSWDSSNIDLIENIEKEIKGKKLFYIKEIVDINEYECVTQELKETLKLFQETISKIKDMGVLVEEVSIDKELLETLSSVYTCISCAEATSNMSNLTGIIFGPRGKETNINEMITTHRTVGFSPLIKRRFVIGSYVLQKENQEKYFVNAQKIRSKIVSIMKEYFKEYDALILPCSEKGAPTINDANETLKKDYNILENHLVIGNFGGFPSITIPNGFVGGLPVGINLTSNIKEDEKLLNIAFKIEEKLEYKEQISGGVK